MDKDDQTKSEIQQKELDYILDAALDELDDSDSDHDEKSGENEVEGTNTKSNRFTNNSLQSDMKRPTFGPEIPPKHNDVQASSEEAAIKEMMRHMEALLSSESFNDASTNTKDNKNSNNIQHNSNDKMPKIKSQNKSAQNQNDKMEETMSKLFEQLSQNMGDNEFDEGNFGALGEDFMKEMAKEWESTLDSNGDDDQEEVVGQVVDGMMKQLLSKEFMYEPMKDICNQFPKWLAENKHHLNDQEYKRYGKQYQYFQRIVHIYEFDPDNVARLTELMQEIQEYGQPPPELIKELAPDLDFDKDGMPRMDGGLMNEECILM